MASRVWTSRGAAAPDATHHAFPEGAAMTSFHHRFPGAVDATSHRPQRRAPVRPGLLWAVLFLLAAVGSSSGCSEAPVGRLPEVLVMSIDGEIVMPGSRLWLRGSRDALPASVLLDELDLTYSPEDVALFEREIGFPRPYLTDEDDRLWASPWHAENATAWGLYERLGATDLHPVDAGGGPCPNFDACTFEIRARRAPMAYEGYREDYWDARPEEWVHATMSLPSWDELQAWSGGSDEVVTDSRYDGVIYAATRYLYVGFDGDDVTIEMRATNGAEPIRARIHDR